MYTKKGQVALEFLVYAGVFLLIAVSAYTLTYFTQRSEVAIRESQMFKEFGYKFQYAAIVAYRGGPGFTYDFYFDKSIDGKPFDLVYMTVGRNSNVKTVWNGTSSEYVYLYPIPLAQYEPAAGEDCFNPAAGGTSISVDKANGHILLSNEGVKDGNIVIRVHCGG